VARSTPRSLKTMVKSLQENQKQLLLFMVGMAPGPVTDSQLRQALDLEHNKQLAGLLSGIHKAAKRSEIELTELFTKESSRDAAGDRTYEYQINASNLDDIKAGLNAK
jgi:hypothetical protein